MKFHFTDCVFLNTKKIPSSLKSGNSNYEPLFKPNEITVARMTNAVKNASPAKDKFASRLSSYGLLKTGEDSPSTVRARAPLHREPLTSEVAHKPAMVHSPSVSSTTTGRSGAAPFQVNFRYLGMLFCATFIIYVILMQWQSNPANPLLE